MAYTKQVPDYKAVGTEMPPEKLTSGFVPGEKPPANWFNYLFNRITQAIKELQTRTYDKGEVDTRLNAKLNRSDVLGTTGIDTTKTMSQKAITDQINALNTKKFNVADISNITGTSEVKVLSQKTVTENLNTLNAAVNGKLPTANVLQTTGNGVDKVMSQKAVTDKINSTKNEVVAKIPVIRVGTQIPGDLKDGEFFALIE